MRHVGEGARTDARMHVDRVGHSGASGGKTGDGVDEVIPRDPSVANHFPDLDGDARLDKFPEAPNCRHNASQSAMLVVGVEKTCDEVACEVAIRNQVSWPAWGMNVEQVKVGFDVGESYAEGIQLTNVVG